LEWEQSSPTCTNDTELESGEVGKYLKKVSIKDRAGLRLVYAEGENNSVWKRGKLCPLPLTDKNNKHLSQIEERQPY